MKKCELDDFDDFFPDLVVKRLHVERLTHETNGNVSLSSPKSWESC